MFTSTCFRLFASNSRRYRNRTTRLWWVTIDRIASLLTAVGRLGGPVVDQTGLSGQFDFTLQFTPEPKGAPQPQDVVADGFQVTLQEALHEQLGLKLKPTKAPLESLVIDHAEPPAAN
jgi:bla regulator protein blaR1